MQITFRQVADSDIKFITDVYNHYVLHSTATFRTVPIEMHDIPDIYPVNHPKYKTFIIDYKNRPVGFCAIDRFRQKEAYDRTAEVHVYINPEFIKSGVGTHSLAFLEKIAAEIDVKVLIAYITAENEGSVKLFESCGYKNTANLKNIGEKFNRVLDVVIYQKDL